jgi:hypothetical protein
MNNGSLIFAHNNRDVDYILLALISGGLAKKHLNAPVSLVTDSTTLEWAEHSGIYTKVKEVFDQVILVNKPKTDNKRNLHDGTEKKSIDFTNTNRCSAYELSPYDRTLLLDSDFLIFSNRLAQYWDVDEPIMVAYAMNDICSQQRMGYHDRYVSDTGAHLLWATTVMFSKDSYSELFFDLVNQVKQNYQYYADLFRFDPRQFRNDIAFGVAKHILDGFEHIDQFSLPSLLTVQDKDILHSVRGDKLTFLVSTNFNQNYILASTQGVDVHVMNKQSIVRNKEFLLELI